MLGSPAIALRPFIEGIFNLRVTDQSASGRGNSGRSGGASHAIWANGRRQCRPPDEAPAGVEAWCRLARVCGPQAHEVS